MNKSQICIVIPVYKERLNDFEIQSVFQCLKILSNYKIHFICPEGLDIGFYKSQFSGIQNYFFFDSMYFKDFKGYNRLMLHPDFYKTFNNFEYMLIYQTDCYVFSDLLMDWSMKGFDYIGGVWFDDFVGNPYLGSRPWQAGNGGLSLRKIDSIIEILTSKKPRKNSKELIKSTLYLYKVSRALFLKAMFLFPLSIFGFRNNYSFFAKNYKVNEDFFFIEVGQTHKDFKVPDVTAALLFSWDRYPEFLYQELGEFPFGCHAWFRDDELYGHNKEFWTKKIAINEYS